MRGFESGYGRCVYGDMVIATPPSSRGGSQSSLTVTLSVAVVFRVYCKLTGGEGGPIHYIMHNKLCHGERDLGCGRDKSYRKENLVKQSTCI